MPVAFPRLTPWVGRLIAANAVVMLLLATVLTSPGVEMALAFSPGSALTRPWSFITYMFVHGGLLHLGGNMLALYIFGTAVENRMGSRRFLFFYFYCGVGAAVFSFALSGLMHVDPFIGASGAVLGVAVAFALFWPDAEILVFPFPIPIRAKTLVMVLVGIAAFSGLVLRNSASSDVAHLAHLGGALAGYLYFRIQALSQRPPAAVARRVERVVTVSSPVRDVEANPAPRVRPLPRPTTDPLAAELDRVLDKISATGMSSLTPEERRFLDEFSKKKKDE